MAKINRIRIINFYYNNDARQIADETFHFYGGENALLNLANGGGKSVLVQLMMQPIIPDYKLQKRSMNSYFKRSTYPAFIMIEWALDNSVTKDYLMTGIAIAPKMTTEEQAGNRMNYFTFASHYSEACDLDIAFVPFAKQEGERQIILPFERAREAVKKIVSENREIFYYSRDEGMAYRELLQRYGISQEEWKNIIAKMNNDEGGIDELFDKCNSSDGVLNGWIIKTIENSIIKTGDEDTQIHDLMEDLVANTVRNEEYIRDQKNMKAYFEDHMELEKSLETVYTTMDAYAKTEDNMNRLHGLLMRESKNIELDIQNLNVDTEELRNNLSVIDQEEASDQYYQTTELHEELSCEEQEVKSEQEAIGSLLQSNQKDRDILKAANLYTKCKELHGIMNALRLQIEEKKQDVTIGERIKDLKYSLRTTYEKEIRKHQHNISDFEQFNIELLQELSKLKQQMQEHNHKKEILGKQIAVLQAGFDQFLEAQNKLFERLGIGLIRNLLGDFEEKEVEKVRLGFREKMKELKHQLEQYESRLKEIQERLPMIVKIQKDLLIKMNNNEKLLQKLHSDKELFAQQEESCKKILLSYEIPEHMLYRREELHRELEKRLQRLENMKFSTIVERNQIKEMLEGITTGNVYFPKTLAVLLEERDIAFQTGEDYLNGLKEERRRKLLAGNPLLPYSFVLKKNDLSKLAHIKFAELLLRQLVPVFTYDSLTCTFEKEQELIHMEGFPVIGSYEEKLFIDQERANYLDQLNEGFLEAQNKVEHITEELSKVRGNLQILVQFEFTEDYLQDLLQNIQKEEEAKELMVVENRQLEEEAEALEKEKAENVQQLELLKQEFDEYTNRFNHFEEFLVKDISYRKNLEACNELELQEKSLLEQIGKQETLEKKLEEKKYTIDIKTRDEKNYLEHRKQTLIAYEEAEEAQVLDLPLEELEQEYRNLMQNMDRTLTDLESRLEEKGKDLEEKQSELTDYSLEEAEYSDVRYEKTRYDEIIRMIAQLSQDENAINKKLFALHDLVIKAEVKKETAMARLQEHGLTTPLEKSQILQNYSNRRKNIRWEMDHLKKQQETIRRRQTLCVSKLELIQNLVEIHYVPAGDMKLREEIELQFKELNQEHNKAKGEMEKAKRGYLECYGDIRKKNEGKHPSITDILTSVETLKVNDAGTTSEKVYYYLEELMKKRESLSKYLEFFEQQLQMIEHTKKQVIDQCVSYGMLIYEGVKAISEKSKIRITGKSRPIQMLKIALPTEVDSNAVERMSEYINRVLELSVSDYKKSLEENTGRNYRNRLRSLVSARELLNVIIGTHKISVSVYKIDLNDKNSGMKRWEEAMAENSGGEKFVVFFTMISTLISYTRDALGKREGVDTRNESKVMIMDNPFARTSSEHLLKAVIDIAKTFHIQLICLSDLSQSSITNRFSLIYMLSVRKKIYSGNELLKIEKVHKNKEGLVEDERLEHAALHYQSFEQENLFDWI